MEDEKQRPSGVRGALVVGVIFLLAAGLLGLLITLTRDRAQRPGPDPAPEPAPPPAGR
jgi:hypothetical protein